jgi:hypothetical protein
MKVIPITLLNESIAVILLHCILLLLLETYLELIIKNLFVELNLANN